jgi:hypothetical protein
MKLFKKNLLSPRNKRKAFEVYNENSPASPRKVKRIDDKENPIVDLSTGLNTSRRIASMAINIKDKVTKPFATHESNFAVTSVDMENDYQFNKKLYKVNNAIDASEGADFDDLIVKEVASPPHIPVNTEYVFSPSKRILTTDRTRQINRVNLNSRFNEVISKDQEDEASASYNNFEELSTHLRLSLNDKRFADVVIRCGMSLEYKFYAHRIILANRSRYFESLFSASALELRAGRFCVDKPSMFADIFAKVLEYMYTGFINLRLDNVLEVLSLSEEFGIDSLKSLCERFITQNIDVNNACLLLELSRQYKAHQLTTYVLEFIENRENIKAVLASESCSNLSRETLKCIIERDTLQLATVDEIHVFNSVVNWIKKQGDCHIDDILELIRFPIMTPQQLNEVVEPQGIVPQELLFQAYRHHLVPQRNTTFHRFMPRDQRNPQEPQEQQQQEIATTIPEIVVTDSQEKKDDNSMVEIRLDDSVQSVDMKE